MEMDSLHRLFVEELRDVYDAEHQLIKALPMMAEKAHFPELIRAFHEHLAQTRVQVDRLDRAFELLGEKAQGASCDGMKGLLKEGKHVAGSDGDAATVDAGLIAAAQEVEHYEIATYGTLCSWAETMGHTRVHELLSDNLAEEKETDRNLTALAEQVINLDAVQGGFDGTMPR